jgi:hypothetical protein
MILACPGKALIRGPGRDIAPPPRPKPPAGTVTALLPGQRGDGGFGVHPYRKWTGAHWRLVSLVELFLTHRLFRSLATGQVINRAWLAPRYPPYWHYDILHALLVLSRMGKAVGPRR